MAIKRITGGAQITNNIAIASNEYLRVVSEATEKTAVAVSNDAKADHTRGLGHAAGRYENDTGTLTRSITPVLTKVDFSEIEAQVYSNISYAPKVELGEGRKKAYPFLLPAALANSANFMKNIQVALSGL